MRDLYSDLEIDGRVLDLAAPSREHFDVPPDELVAFDGDPDARCPTATTRSTTCCCSSGVGG